MSLYFIKSIEAALEPDRLWQEFASFVQVAYKFNRRRLHQAQLATFIHKKAH